MCSSDLLDIGGEGMEGFYDKMLPNYLNTYGKKYGTQVNLHGYVEPINKGGLKRNAEGQYVEFPPETIQLHSFDITPQMRQDIMSEGLPMFAGGGAVKAPMGGEYNTDPDMQDGGNVIQGTVFKKGGRVNVSNNPDAMMMEVSDRKFGAGGTIKKGIKAIKEALPLAEREANLNKFLENSAVKKRLYQDRKSTRLNSSH